MFCVDTLFPVNDIFLFFSSRRKLIKARIIEWLIIGEHTMNRMQQLTHDGAGKEVERFIKDFLEGVSTDKKADLNNLQLIGQGPRHPVPG